MKSDMDVVIRNETISDIDLAEIEPKQG